MTMNLFDQFLSPKLLGMHLLMLAMILPLVLLPRPSTRWLNNRMLSIQNWFIATFIKQIFTPINYKGHKWAMLLTTLVLYLMLLNLMGLLPYTFTPTTQLSLNLALAFPLWLATVLIGFRNNPTTALSHLLPMGTPILLIPILITIETISLLIRPIALAVRLTANLTAGHLLIQLVSMGVSFLISISPLVAFITFMLLILLTFLEIAVAMIQAYVFVLLLSLYLQENT